MRKTGLMFVAAVIASTVGYAAENQTIKKPNDGFKVQATDWPWWRGPMRDGTADDSQKPPTDFSATKNLIWTAKIPGRGYGSPMVFGDRVFLASCDESSGAQSMLCFSRKDGTPLWNTVVHEGGALRKNEKSTGASSTPACDGQHVFINFPNNDSLVTTALDLNGKIVWQKTISGYQEHQGYGASPALYQDMVIVTSDNKAGGAIMALRRDSGEVVWKRDRPAKPNYPSPIILHVADRDQVVLVGCDQIVSYDPRTGDTLWEMAGATTECVTSTLTNGELIYTSGGYPENHMSAIKADGSCKVVWKNSTRLYVPSLVQRDGYLYGVLDAGIAMCWDASTGKEMWKQRLGGTFSASATLVGDLVYIPNEAGEFFVFRAQPSKYEQVAKNKVGEEALATPVIVDSRIYYRAVAEGTSTRQEVLYCFGE